MVFFNMDSTPLDNNIKMAPLSIAFILYRPGTKKTKERVFYNNEAWRILFQLAPLSGKDMASFPDLPSLCSRWKDLLDRKLDELKGSSEGSGGVNFIDILRSGKRRYTVRGAILSAPYASQKKEKQVYMFIFERVSPDKLNLPMIFRQWNLNNREQDIVRLLFEGQSNKEIAHTLNLSLNTVKSYMKLLFRKVGISGRAGLIGRFLAGR